MSELSLAEARAILIADEALQISYERRLKKGYLFGSEEREAWSLLVKAAEKVLAAHREVMRKAAQHEEESP